MIRKWPINLLDGMWFAMPSRTEVIHVGEQYGRMTAWTRDLPQRNAYTDYEVRVFGTGETPPDDAEHLGTVQIDVFVWHLFGRAVK